MHAYGDLSDDLTTKKHLPLMKHIYRIFQELGVEYFENTIEKLSGDVLYQIFKQRLDNSINLAKHVIENRVSEPSKIMTYAFFPPVITIRSDLQQGTGKLLYGESNDISFVAVHDITREIFFVLNLHCEDGIPVDWWLAGPNDELLDRRHIKYGYKLKDIPKKSKNLEVTGNKLLDILKDVRNERTPQWSNSMYTIATVFGTSMLNILNEISNFETLGSLFDGINVKNFLGEYLFCYIPWPPMIGALVRTNRNKFILRLIGLIAQGNLYITQIESKARSIVDQVAPEVLKYGCYEIWEKDGVQNPQMTLGVKLPDLKNKDIYENENFNWSYPADSRYITLEDLNMDVEQALNGILTNFTKDTPINSKISNENIISTGLGLSTKF